MIKLLPTLFLSLLALAVDTTKDCIDCVNVIEVNPFDVMKIPNAKACAKCVK